MAWVRPAKQITTAAQIPTMLFLTPRNGECSSGMRMLWQKTVRGSLKPCRWTHHNAAPAFADTPLRLLHLVKRIVDAKAQFRSLAEPWADTGTSTGRLMLAVLGGLADVERDLIRTRTAEGRSRAKAQGKRMGRPPSLTHRHSRKRPSGDARRARRSKNLPAAIMSAEPRSHGSRPEQNETAP